MEATDQDMWLLHASQPCPQQHTQRCMWWPSALGGVKQRTETPQMTAVCRVWWERPLSFWLTMCKKHIHLATPSKPQIVCWGKIGCINILFHGGPTAIGRGEPPHVEQKMQEVSHSLQSKANSRWLNERPLDVKLHTRTLLSIISEDTYCSI